MRFLIDKLRDTQELNREEWLQLLNNRTPELAEYLFEQAQNVRQRYYGKDVYIRGLIEFTNFCKNDCYYCGIRKSNTKACRYRLSAEDILDCCQKGYELGFRTFVLQGGEDGYFTDDMIVDMILHIKQTYPDCAVTLSIGEKSFESYQRFHDAGAERYLLRHETYDEEHYGNLHPSTLSAKERQRCLWDLKKIGYQVGAGFMVGSPGQTTENIADDMLFLKRLSPQMVGVGPFIPHKDTPYAKEKSGTLELTLFLLGLVRLTLPTVLLPATTALGTIDTKGRQLGILAGANVVMPNLSPQDAREKYLLYNEKIHQGSEAAEGLQLLKKEIESIGYHLVSAKGDPCDWKEI